MHYPTFKKLVKLLALSFQEHFNSHGILNLMILISLITLFFKDKINDEKLNDLLDTRGFVSRMVGPYFKFISHSWHVLPLGLFGLGFDTASEISLLALSSGASQAISFLKFRKDKINDEKLNDLLDSFVSRMVGPYFKFISHSWHVCH